MDVLTEVVNSKSEVRVGDIVSDSGKWYVVLIENSEFVVKNLNGQTHLCRATTLLEVRESLRKFNSTIYPSSKYAFQLVRKEVK